MPEAQSLVSIVPKPVTPVSPDLPMRTLVFTSQKGGSGKTTLCGQLAVQAHESGMGPVALVDTDPQGSLADWWNARGDETLMFVQTAVDYLDDTLKELRAVGVKLVFIDTQPTVTPLVRTIVQAADMAIIPTRPSPHDLRAVGATLDLIESCDKPMIFVINSAARRATITADAAVALSQHGTVAPVTVHNRTDFATSMINGGSVVELAPNSASAKEIRELWAYIGDRLQRLKVPYPRLVETTEPAEEGESEVSGAMEDFELEEDFDSDDDTETSVPTYAAEESEVRGVMDLLGFDEDAIDAEFEEFQEVLSAQKEQSGFGRRVSFGRRGNVRTIGA